MKTQEIDSLRACFPALDRTRNQRPVAYFDGPGGTQVPRCVVEAMSEYLCCHNANTHSAYAASIETDEIILSARHSFADFFNAAPEEVAFGANMTTLTYHVARALGRRLNRSGGGAVAYPGRQCAELLARSELAEDAVCARRRQQPWVSGELPSADIPDLH